MAQQVPVLFGVGAVEARARRSADPRSTSVLATHSFRRGQQRFRQRIEMQIAAQIDDQQTI